MNQQLSFIHAVRANARGKNDLENEEIAALHSELAMARKEAATVPQLQAEIRARTAAMENLQAQLDKTEALRAEELASSGSRFRQLEAALTDAEREVAEARTEASAAIARAEELRSIAIEEVNHATELLQQAEEVMKKIGGFHSEPTGISEAMLTESDAEALLDALEVAQEENASLRQQLAMLAAAGNSESSASGELAEALTRELAAARAAASEAKAEVEALKCKLRSIKGESSENMQIADDIDKKAAIVEGLALLRSTLDLALPTVTDDNESQGREKTTLDS